MINGVRCTIFLSILLKDVDYLSQCIGNCIQLRRHLHLQNKNLTYEIRQTGRHSSSQIASMIYARQSFRQVTIEIQSLNPLIILFDSQWSHKFDV